MEISLEERGIFEGKKADFYEKSLVIRLNDTGLFMEIRPFRSVTVPFSAGKSTV